MRCELERGARPCARFDEKVDQRLPAQRRHFFDLPRADLFERVRGLEHEIDFVGRKIAQTELFGASPRKAGARAPRPTPDRAPNARARCAPARPNRTTRTRPR